MSSITNSQLVGSTPKNTKDTPLHEKLSEMGKLIHESNSIIEGIFDLINKKPLAGECDVMRSLPEYESIGDVADRYNEVLESTRDKARAIHQQLEWHLGDKLDLK